MSGIAARTYPPAVEWRRAVRRISAARHRSPAAIARELYVWHTRPHGPGQRVRLDARAHVAAHVGLWDQDVEAASLLSHWVAAPRDDDWFAYDARTIPGDAAYKLYVSPASAYLPDALDAALGVFTAHDAVAFKVGATLTGILRPDNVVAYFADAARLRAGASLLARMLAGMPAHGVPFTAPLTSCGLLSWAMDPPHSATSHARSVADAGTTNEMAPPTPSWRGWVTGRIGAHVAAACADESDPTPWRTALRRLHADDGVNPATWEPPVAWRRAT